MHKAYRGSVAKLLEHWTCNLKARVQVPKPWMLAGLVLGSPEPAGLQ